MQNSGLLNASSVVSEGGRIFLRATKSIELANTSKVGADGTAGGNITAIVAENGQITGELKARGEISAQGNGLIGSGGFVETSAAKLDLKGFRVRTLGGKWLIDPNDFTIAASGGDIDGATLSDNLADSDTVVQSSDGTADGNGDIFVNDSVNWDTYKLTLSASRNIEINAPLNGSGSASLALEYGQALPE